MTAKRRTVAHSPRRNGTLARLLELQAMAQMQMAKADERMARSDERSARLERSVDERFASVDQRLARLEHGMNTILRLLETLPEAIRDKIGFAPVKPATP